MKKERFYKTFRRSKSDLNFLLRKLLSGLAPIHLATLTGSCEVIEELLKMDADIDLKVRYIIPNICSKSR
jgi:hypothetical protein